MRTERQSDGVGAGGIAHLTYTYKHTQIKNKQQRQTRHMSYYLQPVSNERKRGARPSEARQAFDGVPQNKGGGV